MFLPQRKVSAQKSQNHIKITNAKCKSRPAGILSFVAVTPCCHPPNQPATAVLAFQLAAIENVTLAAVEKQQKTLQPRDLMLKLG